MRKILAVSIAALFLTFCFILYPLSTFPIERDWSNLDTSLDRFVNRSCPEGQAFDVTAHDAISLGSTTYLLLTVDGDLGIAVATRGPLGRYRLDHVTCGTPDTRSEIVTDNGTQYLLFAGQNPDLEIARASVRIDGVPYQLDIPRQKYFLVCTALQARTDALRPDLGSARAYDVQGMDVTEQAGWHGGGGF